MSKSEGSRSVDVDRKIIGPAPLRPITARQLKRGDFPGVSKPHLDLSELLASPVLYGPPLCEELVALVEHTFTEEEARLARHLELVRTKTASAIARAEHRPLAEVAPLLDSMAFEKFVILGHSRGAPEQRYRAMPVMPGIFESVLMAHDLESLSDWHIRFAELFEALYDTGYPAQFGRQKMALVRFFPVADAVSTHPAALPSDKIEVILDRYDSFAMGNCQCRMAMKAVGKGCDRPLANCMSMGAWADSLVSMGQMKPISKKDALEIKLEAETHGLVNWIMNVDGSKGQVSCSCCGCCCHGMRAINEFDAPAISAPPHFLPKFDRSKCRWCGKCAKACPMGALSVDVKGKQGWQTMERCIGCGQCVVACSKRQAIEMEPVPDYRLPPGSWFALIAGAGHKVARNLLGTYWARSPASTWWKG